MEREIIGIMKRREDWNHDLEISRNYSMETVKETIKKQVSNNKRKTDQIIFTGK